MLKDITNALPSLIAAHVAAHNDHDPDALIATFAPDAVMRFEGVPAGPYEGLDQIARAYAEQPPSDTMSCVSDARDGDHDVVRFAWDAGGGGTLQVAWHDGAVAGLAVTFDA